MEEELCVGGVVDVGGFVIFGVDWGEVGDIDDCGKFDFFLDIDEYDGIEC